MAKTLKQKVREQGKKLGLEGEKLDSYVENVFPLLPQPAPKAKKEK